MNILLDMGNSRLKWGIEHNGRVDRGMAVDYRRPDFINELQYAWEGLSRPGKLAVASVAEPVYTDKVVDLACNLWPGLEVLFPKVNACAYGVSNAYRQPEKLGIDRWLALLAVHRYYPGACCIVDCGTAITVDVITAEGRHLGGLISPGLLLMKKSLAANTAALSVDSRQSTCGLADTTAAAIDNGTLLAATGLIETVFFSLDKPCQLIICGGDADIVAGRLHQPHIVDAELVLKGLVFFCNP